MIAFRAVVTRIEEKTRAAWRSGLGKEAVFDTVSDGWWVTLNYRTSYCVGERRPEGVAEGDSVIVRLEKLPW